MRVGGSKGSRGSNLSASLVQSWPNLGWHPLVVGFQSSCVCMGFVGDDPGKLDESAFCTALAQALQVRVGDRDEGVVNTLPAASVATTDTV